MVIRTHFYSVDGKGRLALPLGIFGRRAVRRLFISADEKFGYSYLSITGQKREDCRKRVYEAILDTHGRIDLSRLGLMARIGINPRDRVAVIEDYNEGKVDIWNSDVLTQLNNEFTSRFYEMARRLGM